jgi:uncharacterized protein Yka (UPF0111/DUF47 family)
MKLDGILQFLIPKDKKFFPLFEQATANMVKTSEALCALSNTTTHEKRKDAIREIERLEHVGDNITHMIFNELGTNSSLRLTVKIFMSLPQSSMMW